MLQVSIGVDFMQVYALFASFRFPWPPIVSGLFDFATIFSFSIEQTAPECAISSTTYFQKWAYVQLSPIVLCAAVVVFYLAVFAAWGARQRAFSAPALRAAVGRCTDLTVGGCATVAYYFYFVLVRGAVEVFDCTGAIPHLQADPSIACGGPLQAAMVPYASASLGVYGLGIPLMFAVILVRHRDVMARDVVLSTLGGHDSDATNRDYWVRRRYGRLYLDFEPQYYYWKLVILFRKMSLVVLTILFSSNPMFQAACALGVMTTSYVVHTVCTPFYGGAAHPRGVSGQGTVLGAAAAAAAAAGARHLQNLNRLESTMLRAAIAVLIGGMMVRRAAGACAMAGESDCHAGALTSYWNHLID
jgi:hypothetical protein